MLARFLLLRRLPRRLFAPPQTQTLISPPHLRPPPPAAASFASLPLYSLRSLSTHRGGGGDDGSWKFTPENDDIDSLFGHDEGNLSGITEEPADVKVGRGDGEPWSVAPEVPADLKGDLFSSVGGGFVSKGAGEAVDDWETAEGYTPWTIGGEDDGKESSLFADVGEGGEQLGIEGIGDEGFDMSAEEQKRLEEKEKELMAKVKGKR